MYWPHQFVDIQGRYCEKRVFARCRWLPTGLISCERRFYACIANSNPNHLQGELYIQNQEELFSEFAHLKSVWERRTHSLRIKNDFEIWWGWNRDYTVGHLTVQCAVPETVETSNAVARRRFDGLSYSGEEVRNDLIFQNEIKFSNSVRCGLWPRDGIRKRFSKAFKIRRFKLCRDVKRLPSFQAREKVSKLTFSNLRQISKETFIKCIKSFEISISSYKTSPPKS